MTTKPTLGSEIWHGYTAVLLTVILTWTSYLCASVEALGQAPITVCTAHPVEAAARFTGSANCTACRNCTRCAYCNSGGSCGVCSSSRRRTRPIYSPRPTGPRSSGASKRTYSDMKRSNLFDSESVNIDSVTTVIHAYVASPRLNLRKGPGTTYGVITTLSQMDELIVLEANGAWYKVEVVGSNLSGYVH